MFLLTDISRGPDAERALDGRLIPSGMEPGGEIVRYEQATYDFAQLKEWADQMIPLLKSGAAILIDVDEVRNRVFVGVGDQEAIPATLARAEEIELPEDAFAVELVERPTRSNLRAYTATLMGGYQIDVLPGTAGNSGECSFGFNATFDGVPVFVTASHCTRQWYSATDGYPLYQPLYGQGNPIGYEVRDVAPSTCIPSTDLCRRSDAAYVSHDAQAGRTVAQGQIARSYTAPWAGVAGDWSTVYSPPHRISQVNTGAVAIGTVLNKTGRTTGQTWGSVNQTCVNLGAGAPPYGQWWPPFYFRCQDRAYLGGVEGDSGSPVYQVLGGSNHEVSLVGIVWARSGGQTYYSRFSGIQYDLGALTSVCYPGYGC